jgi:hypothetical protein
VPSSRPGCLAPHAWLHDGSSLYDHFGAGFTLLARPHAPAHELDSALTQAREQGIALAVIQPAEGGVAALYPSRYTLIRPDQHVAWRGDNWPGASLLRKVTGRMPP